METDNTLRHWHVMTTKVDDEPELAGHYLLSTNSLDYKDNDNDDFKDYFSHSPVQVIRGHVLTVDLIKACDELHDATGYWGCYIEGLKLRPDTNTIEVSFGS